jgi:hypothetical protein
VALAGLADALLTVRTSHAPARRCGVANPKGGQRLAAPAAAADIGGHHSRLFYHPQHPKPLFKTAFGCVICVRSVRVLSACSSKTLDAEDARTRWQAREKGPGLRGCA